VGGADADAAQSRCGASRVEDNRLGIMMPRGVYVGRIGYASIGAGVWGGQAGKRAAGGVRALRWRWCHGGRGQKRPSARHEIGVFFWHELLGRSNAAV